MQKKELKKVIILLVATIIIIISSIIVISNDQNYKIIYVGYIDNAKSAVLIDNYDSFSTYLEKYSRKIYDEYGNIISTTTDELKKEYDENYFKDNNLAIQYVPTNSGSIKIKWVRTKIKDDTLEIKYDLDVPKIGTMDMNGFIIIVETDKSIKKVR